MRQEHLHFLTPPYNLCHWKMLKVEILFICFKELVLFIQCLVGFKCKKMLICYLRMLGHVGRYESDGIVLYGYCDGTHFRIMVFGNGRETFCWLFCTPLSCLFYYILYQFSRTWFIIRSLACFKKFICLKRIWKTLFSLLFFLHLLRLSPSIPLSLFLSILGIEELLLSLHFLSEN